MCQLFGKWGCSNWVWFAYWHMPKQTDPCEEMLPVFKTTAPNGDEYILIVLPSTLMTLINARNYCKYNFNRYFFHFNNTLFIICW